MTLEYRCSNCGSLLQTTNADPVDAEMDRMRKLIENLKAYVLPPEAGFATSPEVAMGIYQNLVRVLYAPDEGAEMTDPFQHQLS